MNKIVLQLDPGPGNARNSEATFVTLKSGRIVLAWSKFTSDNRTDFGAGVIAARYSDDGGHTWSHNDQVIIEQEGSTNVMSPSLLRLQDGRIALLYLRKDGDHICLPWIRFSSDEMESWSDPICLSLVQEYQGVNNDRIFQTTVTKPGRIIVPACQIRLRGPSSTFADPELEGDATVQPDFQREPMLSCASLNFAYLSDDGGQTWYESLGSFYRCDEYGWGLDEPGAIELNDGRIWCWQRSGRIGLPGIGGRQWEAFSSDGGNTWTEPEPSQFVSPCSPMQVKRIPKTGHLLAVWNDQSGRFHVPPPQEISWGRTPLVSAISKDEGASWEHPCLLEDAPDQGFCYPAIHFQGENVLLSYNAGGIQSKNPLDTQRVRLIGLDELYA